VAFEVLIGGAKAGESARPLIGSRQEAYLRDLKTQFVSALLFVLTVAAVCCAIINFRQQSLYRLADDGVIWVDRPDSNGRNTVVALHVPPRGEAENAGIRTGDVLLQIAGTSIGRATDVAKTLQHIVIWDKPEYLVRRGNVQFPAHVVVGETVVDRAVYYQYVVGIVYLLIGLFVYYRRVNAPRSVHFYILCLASFVFSCFHFTGKLNAFDQVIYWGNVAAGILAPTIFLDFCLAFPERPKWLNGRMRAALIYLPGATLFAIYVLVGKGMLRVSASPVEVNWLLDRTWMLYVSVVYLAGAMVLAFKTPQTDEPLVRQQLKYLRNGALFGIVPFTLIYSIPYVLGALPGHYQKLAVLSLALVPVTWVYAILRYRLMDVDIIFQQGYVYTLATLVVLGIFYGLIFSFTKPEDLSPAAIVGLILFATFIFQPIRDWLQEQLDRYFFYKDRYDYRRTLIEFARELGSETNLDEMLRSVSDRLVHTLSIQHVAFFLSGDDDDRFNLHMTMGHRKERNAKPLDQLDLSFLSSHPEKPYLFFERTRHLLDVVSHEWPISVRRTISELDLTYYFPCTVRGRTIAYLGLSRTDKGDFLSSDDVELLITLSGYVSIAVENSRLYRSLQHKVDEYERLKEFSENIVESINVGILAADLEDRVESWNTQIERLTGIPRQSAVGRRLAELFPAELCERFDQVRGDTGVHNIYKFVLQSPAGAANGNGHSNGFGHPATHILNLAIAPLVSKDLHQIGRLIIFDDITDRDELERRLVQADKMSSIGVLAAGVAHEVNTPLAVISTYAQMLAKQISGDDQKAKLLDKIAKQTFRASEIVNSLLNFSRTSTTEFVEVDLNKLIRETLSLIEHQLQKSGIDVLLNLEEGLPGVKGNSGKLQQVFLNLFLNARDALEQGGSGGTPARLTIKTWNSEGFARIDVSDNGQGIAPEHLERIYDPFFTTKGARKGTGLGLSVTYGIVREHGGTIEVESRLSTGSRFHLELPLARKLVHA
jgi:signal transduction histidine kinase